MAGCHKDRPHHAKGLCSVCYSRMEQRKRRTLGFNPRPINQMNTCGHLLRAHKAKGMCNACYKRSTYVARPREYTTMKVTCGHTDVPHKAHGLCTRCYDKQHRSQRRASCHPARAHHAKGLCESCYRGQQNRERDRRLAGMVHHTEAQWRQLLFVYPIWPRCKRSWDVVGDPTRDHIRSVVEGGDDSIGNIQPLCFSCNSQKQHKSEFYSLGGDAWVRRRLSIVSETTSMCI